MLKQSRRLLAVSNTNLTSLFGHPLFVSQPGHYVGVFLFIHLCLAAYLLCTYPSASASLAVSSLVLYGLAAVVQLVMGRVDPGVVPKVLLEYDCPGEEGIPLNRELLRGTLGEEGYYINREYGVGVRGQVLGVRLCSECFVYRPPRTAHCYVCNICVERMDHHCPWLGVCIGKRNYRLYLGYLALMLSLTIVLFVQVGVFLHRTAFADQPGEFVGNCLLAVALVPVGLFVGVLLGLHCKLACCNITTN